VVVILWFIKFFNEEKLNGFNQVVIDPETRIDVIRSSTDYLVSPNGSYDYELIFDNSSGMKQFTYGSSNYLYLKNTNNKEHASCRCVKN
jgi:hypothetical protein